MVSFDALNVAFLLLQACIAPYTMQAESNFWCVWEVLGSKFDLNNLSPSAEEVRTDRVDKSRERFFFTTLYPDTETCRKSHIVSLCQKIETLPLCIYMKMFVFSLQHHVDRGTTATAFAMNEDFSRTLEKQMDIFNSPDGDQVSSATHTERSALL